MSSEAARFRGRGVYPRVCGVDAVKIGGQRFPDGLSPRVRGRYLHFDFLPTAEAGGIPVAYETRSSLEGSSRTRGRGWRFNGTFP